MAGTEWKDDRKSNESVTQAPRTRCVVRHTEEMGAFLANESVFIQGRKLTSSEESSSE
jgi:hypothetical protein